MSPEIYEQAIEAAYEDGFLAGIAAVKEALKDDLKHHWVAWDAASPDTRCDYVDELEVEIP